MLNTKKSLIALGFGIGLTSLFASAGGSLGACCNIENSRSVQSCIKTNNNMGRTECTAAYASDLAQCLAGGNSGPWGCYLAI